MVQEREGHKGASGSAAAQLSSLTEQVAGLRSQLSEEQANHEEELKALNAQVRGFASALSHSHCRT